MTYLKEYLKVFYKALSFFGFLAISYDCFERNPAALYLVYVSLMLGICGPIALGLKEEK